MSIRNHASGHPPTADTRKISEHTPTRCHTEKAVSTITSVPPTGPAMLAAGTVAGLSNHTPARTENRALGILLDDARSGRPVHVEHIPARAGREVPWPLWVPAEVTDAFTARGISAPWTHQALAASHAHAGPAV